MHWRAADPSICCVMRHFRKGRKETLAYHWLFVPLMHIFFRDLCTKQMSWGNPWAVAYPRFHPVYSRPMEQIAEGMLARFSWFILRWWNKHCLSSYPKWCSVFTRSAEIVKNTGGFESCLLQLALTFPVLQDCDSCWWNRIFWAYELIGSTAV